ncbi:MAG: PD-(D/E)XK nuclease family protein [Bacteroidales bacterium]|nr:PD-(D/E)XK nuclease family protein [Bacteroidales bacterium]
MQSFLKQIANHIHSEFNGDFSDVAVILPSQRAKHFLINELCRETTKPIFLPQLFTIDDFIESLSPLKRVSTSELLITLYDICQQADNRNKEDFVKFISWGTMFLKDINDIDLQMKNAHDIFTNLAQTKEIDITLFKETDDKETKRKKYLDFYLSLSTYYDKLREALRENKVGYAGLLYRDVAENIESYLPIKTMKKYVFAGFNAFSPSEATIISYFLKQGLAEIFFDLDSFYYEQKIPDRLPAYSQTVSDLIHLTISRLELTERDVHFIGQNYCAQGQTAKSISVTGISQNMQQVLYAIELLKTFENELDRTAVVFADESLIVPFLHAYDCSKTNLTMGYPLRGLPEYNLIQLIVQMIKNSRRVSEQDSLSFYHRDIVALLRHSVIKTMLFDTDVASEKCLANFIANNKVIVSFEDLKSLFENQEGINTDFSNALLEVMNSLLLAGTAPLEAMINLYDYLWRAFGNSQKEMNRANIYRLILDNLLKVKELISKISDESQWTIEAIEFFINEQCSSITLPIQGNPDKGLQVMGILETRALDFENIILLSANENILPVGKTQNSLIISDIKKYFHLPSYHEQNAVSAYHFFRLLQRAKKVHIIYNNDVSDMSGEKSRFIEQLKFENKRQNAGIEIIEQNITAQPKLEFLENKISIDKTSAILDQLKSMKYSPTGLIKFNQCPLCFYLAKVAQIAPSQDIQEQMDAAIIGTVVHDILEQLFLKLKEKKESVNTEYLSDADIDKIFSDEEKDLDDHLQTAFKKAFNDRKIKLDNLDKGRNFLSKQVCKNYLQKYFTYFKEEAKHISDFVCVENKFLATVKAEDSVVLLDGKIDRIDKCGGKLRILDYKTGKVEPKDLKFSMEDIGKKEKPFQLLCYAYMLKNGKVVEKSEDGDEDEVILTDKFKEYKSLDCGIVGLQSSMKREKECIFGFEVTDEMMEEFAKVLETILKDILDKDQKFSQTEDRQQCAYCDYASICGRPSKK